MPLCFEASSMCLLACLQDARAWLDDLSAVNVCADARALIVLFFAVQPASGHAQDAVRAGVDVGVSQFAGLVMFELSSMA